MAKGRPRKIVAEAFEHWPIEGLPLLPPRLKGLYVLYDPHNQPVRVGIAGRKKQDVQGRLYGYYAAKKWRHVHKFSVYTFATKTHFKQIEALVLRALGTALAGNVRLGKLPRTTKKHKPPRRRYPGIFHQRVVQGNGKITLNAFRGKKVRIEVGP